MTQFKNIIKFIIGVSVIIFITWNRIIREQKPQYYDYISPNYALKCIILIIAFSSIIIYTITKIYRSHYPKIAFTNKTYYIKLLTFIKTYITDAPEYVYERITPNLDLAPIVELPASYLVAHLKNPRVFTTIFYFIPQILVALIFFIEIYFYHQKVFFIKVLSLLLLFLISKTIIFIFKHYSERRLNHYNLFFDIKQNDDGTHIALKAPEELPKHIPLENIVNQYNTMYLTWIIYKSINCYTLEIEYFNKKYISYIRLVIYIFFLLGWSYILFLYLQKVV